MSKTSFAASKTSFENILNKPLSGVSSYTVRTYVRTCIHTYIHTYVHTYARTYVRQSIDQYGSKSLSGSQLSKHSKCKMQIQTSKGFGEASARLWRGVGEPLARFRRSRRYAAAAARPRRRPWPRPRRGCGRIQFTFNLRFKGDLLDGVDIRIPTK